MISAIVAITQHNNTLWADAEFPPDDSSLYKNPLEPPTYVDSDDLIEWRRPHDIFG
jgi:hypothetical protein